MRKLMALSLITAFLAAFGTGFAQNKTQPAQPPPPIQSQSVKTTEQTPTKAAQGARQFRTEDEAKSQCGSDQVVWGNTRSHILHDPGTQYYGKTMQGAYMCKGNAVNAGYREPRAPISAVAASAKPHLSTAAQSKMKVHHVVIQVDQDDSAVMNLALNNADNMKKFYESKGEAVEIEFVAFGGGLKMMRSDTSPVKERLAEMSRQGVTFSGCGNTLANQSRQEEKSLSLLPETHLVPTGVVRISELQEQGWTYLRP
jgi:uncharacterized protein